MSFLNALFPSFSNSFNIPFLSVVRTQGYSSTFVKFGDFSPTSHRGQFNSVDFRAFRGYYSPPLRGPRSQKVDNLLARRREGVGASTKKEES